MLNILRTIKTDSKLVSFDDENLFTNVPVEKIIEIIIIIPIISIIIETVFKNNRIPAQQNLSKENLC